ncbi:hypothetical protein [Wolbachia endosymbiont of Dirofilaria (Dirofilaria) immitis]|uniref:hypothetical protein n=1 Tax=Wolbachia endosymbiont of Dirofilaria (Dirofilaria) immitis TaxID=1812115 RepID=UPI001C551495|nr:hypothetical protein [Wolbachia endosymbiont of Dirofilaria (Dirofilaria) immitis]
MYTKIFRCSLFEEKLLLSLLFTKKRKLNDSKVCALSEAQTRTNTFKTYVMGGT